MSSRPWSTAVFFLLTVSCASPKIEASTGAEPLRVANYNIEWLSEDMVQERRDRLSQIIQKISPNILVVQEVEGSRALGQILDRNWSIAMDDDPGEDQEVAIAVKAPFRIKEWKMLYRGRAYEDAFPNKRDLLRAVVETPGGKTIAVYGVHLRSRRGGRSETDVRRMAACKLIAQQASRDDQKRIIVSGDFNDTPNDESVNALESSNPGFVNLMDSLYNQDYVSVDLERQRGWRQLTQPRIPGAKEENERFRGRSYDYERDVRIKAVLFDQILVSKELASMQNGSAQVYWASGILEGSAPKSSIGTPSAQGTRASDHLPVFADFELK